MDGPRDSHTKWSQTEKDKYHMRSLTCGIYDTNEPIYKTERLTDREQTCGCQAGERIGREMD